MLIFDICNEEEGVVDFPRDKKKPSIFNLTSLLIHLHIFTNSSLNLFLISMIVILEEVKQQQKVAVGQSHKIKMNIKTTNFNYKLSV